MSYSWMLVRGGSANPSSLKYIALMNKQSLTENEIFKPERQQPSIISAHMEDIVAIQDPFMFTKLKNKTIHYKGGYEPDGVRLKLWCKFDHLATILKDRAMSINQESGLTPGSVLRPRGNPKLCKGPDFDDIKGGSIVTRINSDPNTLDYFTILNPEENGLGIQPSLDNAHIGISMFFRFMLEGEPVQHNGVDPTLYHHVDDPNGDYGIIVRIGTNRELKFFTRNAATTRNFISPDNTVVPGVWTTACLTQRFSDNAMTMTINNIPQTDSANETPTFDGTENNVLVGISQGLNSGRFVGRLDDIRYYTNLIFNRDHETNIWNNGRSICAANVISFDGVNDKIACTNDSTLWSQSLTKFSFSFWFYTTTDQDFKTMVSHGLGSSNGFACHQFFNDIAFKINFGAGDVQVFGPFGAINKWHFAVCTYDSTLGSNEMKIYVDGALLGQGNTGGSINLSVALDLGESFQGNMTDFRWWTTIALTEAQVIAVRDNLPTAPLPNYWLKMNEGNGNPTDFITRTKVGTLTNGALWVMGSTPHPIEYGSLSVAGYARFNDTVDTGGFDSTGFDSTGFDTT